MTLRINYLPGMPTLRPKHYVLRGRDVVAVNSLEEWSRSFNYDGRHVGRTQVLDFEVSTVFLGIDRGYEDLMIFETLVFGGKLDGYMWRYSTYEEAERGHQAAVSAVQEAEQ